MADFEQVGIGLGIVAFVLYSSYLGLLADNVLGYIYDWVHGGVDEGPLKGVNVPGRPAYTGQTRSQAREQAKWERYYSQVAKGAR